MDDLFSESAWRAFMACRMERGRLSEKEARALSSFIESGAYKAAALKLCDASLLPPPEKRLLNRSGKAKKRVVYSFSEDISLCLKLLAFLLYKYDSAMPDNLYSFRSGYGAARAVRMMTHVPGAEKLYCYKLDVRDYFNSIDASLLLPMLAVLMADDSELYRFFEVLLTRDEALFEGELIRQKRGVMAGTPTSPFLANVYLAELDRHFLAAGVPYARYSDDILLLAKTHAELEAHRSYILCELSRLNLAVNPDKERVYAPGEPWDFLGAQFQGPGAIGLSRASMDKLKAKLRRKARAIYRWKLKKAATDERAMRAFARAVNKKLFENTGDNELTWAKWFFPIITRDDGLRELDEYIRNYMRYVATGGHGKANYRTPYKTLKEYGLRSLVNEYYRFLSRSNEESRSST